MGWGSKIGTKECRTTDIPEFQITNIKIAKDVLFDYFIYEFIFYYYFFELLENSIKVFDNFSKL